MFFILFCFYKNVIGFYFLKYKFIMYRYSLRAPRLARPSRWASLAPSVSNPFLTTPIRHLTGLQVGVPKEVCFSL